MDHLGNIHHAALTVADLDRSLAWYQDVLAMEVAFSERSDTRRAAILRFPGGSNVVGLVEHGDESHGAFDATRVGLDHLAFTVQSRSDLDGWVQRLEDHGVTHSGAIDVPPGAIVNFKDPDGIALALFWDRA